MHLNFSPATRQSPISHREEMRYFEVKSTPRFTREEFQDFCAENSEMDFELDKNGNILIMPPMDFVGGVREGHAFGLLYAWWMNYRKGKALSPSAGFTLPDTSIRAADASWVSDERLAKLDAGEWTTFARIVPDFVIEVVSTSDRLPKVKKKMTETWLPNGVRLAWLLDVARETAIVYRPNAEPLELKGFDRELSGEDVCPGFVLDLRRMRD